MNNQGKTRIVSAARVWEQETANTNNEQTAIMDECVRAGRSQLAAEFIRDGLSIEAVRHRLLSRTGAIR